MHVVEEGMQGVVGREEDARNIGWDGGRQMDTERDHPKQEKVKSSYGNNMVNSNIQNIETICYYLSFKLENEIKPK